MGDGQTSGRSPGTGWGNLFERLLGNGAFWCKRNYADVHHRWFLAVGTLRRAVAKNFIGGGRFNMERTNEFVAKGRE